MFQGLKGYLLGICPLPRLVFGSQVKERADMMREVLDELPVEIGEPQEGLDFLLILGCWLICYASHLPQVHLCYSMQDDEPKVLHPALFKLILLRLEVEPMLTKAFQNQM